jgi:hypothetical protein
MAGYNRARRYVGQRVGHAGPFRFAVSGLISFYFSAAVIFCFGHR